jgi:hypothetical protein
MVKTNVDNIGKGLENIFSETSAKKLAKISKLLQTVKNTKYPKIQKKKNTKN